MVIVVNIMYYDGIMRSTGTIVLIVVAVLIVLVLIIYASASYVGRTSVSRTSSSTVMATSSTTFLVNPRFLLPSARQANQDQQQQSAANETQPAPPPSKTGFFGAFFSRISSSNDIPAGYTQADLSPYWQKVTIGSVRTSRSTNPTLTPDSVTLRNNAGDASIAITGWKLKSNRNGVTIPHGVRLYHTTPTPLENIELRKGETATIYTNSSPLGGGANFLLNKCTGYLGTGYPFNPSLPLSCPKPAKHDIETFTGQCQDYILRLRSCQIGDAGVPQTAGDSSCRSYIASTLNYEGCVKRYQNDADFWSREWRIWVGQSFLDPLHDRVLLLDSNGKIVDSYTY
jgi:hypothetical protein